MLKNAVTSTNPDQKSGPSYYLSKVRILSGPRNLRKLKLLLWQMTNSKIFKASEDPENVPKHGIQQESCMFQSSL